jgi:predicted nucleotidyltransferase
MSSSGEFGTRTRAFYRRVLETLQERHVEFLVGGSFALHRHTGIERPTKDIDLFLRRTDLPFALESLHEGGFETDIAYPHWLAKARNAGASIDLIFSSGNGVSAVDDDWFAFAPEANVLGMTVKISPVEELIWSKAFVMERERFDGADVVHLIAAQGERIDWNRLLDRFETNGQVLLAHIVLYGYVYPDKRHLVPSFVLDRLIADLRREQDEPPSSMAACHGTLLSREQYLFDIEQRGALDARVAPLGAMSPDDVALWTNAIPRARRVGLRRARSQRNAGTPLSESKDHENDIDAIGQVRGGR